MINLLKTTYRLVLKLWKRAILLIVSFKLKLGKYYYFKFTNLDKWDRIKMRRYISWQLPDIDYRMIITGSCIDEFNSVKKYLDDEYKSTGEYPQTIVDFGCGLGRSSVFFLHMFKWFSSKFIFIDGHKSVYGPKSNLDDSQRLFHKDDIEEIFKNADSFYTDFELIDKFLVSNKMNNYSMIDLNREQNKLANIKDVDLFYSFHSIGYHWDISAVFKYYNLDSIIKPGALLIFGLRQEKDYDNLGHKQLDYLEKNDSILKKGYKKIDLVNGNRLQRFLILKKQG